MCNCEQSMRVCQAEDAAALYDGYDIAHGIDFIPVLHDAKIDVVMNI